MSVHLSINQKVVMKISSGLLVWWVSDGRLVGVHGSVRLSSGKNPLCTALQELIHQQSQVCEDEAADIEAEELGCVANAQFEAHMRRRRVLQARVLNLSRDLI